VTHENITKVNPYSFSEVSNLLFLSQPLGVGFSYEEEVEGVYDDYYGVPVESDTPDGRYSSVDPYRFPTTALAAKGTWEILQAFIQALPSLDETIASRSFNLWTESYGGHYGPGFFDYFYEQNKLIQNGTVPGVELELHTLGIINGIISARIQMEYYPEFAYKNTYGIQAYNESVYEFAKFAWSMPYVGCAAALDTCAAANISDPYDGVSTCAQATAICRSMVEGPYEVLTDNSAYDIRQNGSDPNVTVPPGYWKDFLNTAEIQNALGVDVNYTASSGQVWIGFDWSGDWSYSLLPELEDLLDAGVRVSLIYGDAVSLSSHFILLLLS
jgi:carboxypeptidase C (cathepsin A)